MDTVQNHDGARSDAGHLLALGYLQVGTGALTVTMSLMALFVAVFVSSELFNPARAFDHSTTFFDRILAAYVLLQLTFGWVAGGLQFAAGCCCMKSRPTRLVWVSCVVNLINIPHGAIAGIVTLILGRQRAAHATV